MKFHNTSGKSAASPETTSSSPNPSLCKSAHPELPLAQRANVQQPLRAASEHQMVFESISQPLNIGTDEPYVTKAYVSRRFQMSYRTIERNVADGMPSHPIGKRGVRFIVSEIQRWLDTNARKRFAATGRAAAKAELQRRIAVVPILNGLEIVDSSARPARTPARQFNPGESNALLPRCKPGRKRTALAKLACHANDHKWSKGLHVRSCTVCGITQERDAHNQWVTT
jgi:hypothetical protein